MAGRVLGEAYVRILPNATGFHKKLAGEVQSESQGVDVHIPVDLNDDNFKEEWKAFQEKLEADSKRTKAQIQLELDTKHAWRQARAFIRAVRAEKAEIPVTIKLDQRSLSQEGKKMDQFKKDHERLNMKVKADVKGASAELAAWRASESANSVTQTVVTNHVAGKVPQVAAPGGVGAGFERESQEALNVLNLLPRLLSKANAQFDAGIRQIYDPYVHLMEKMYQAGLKPFKVWNEQVWGASKTLKDFFQRAQIAAYLAWNKIYPKSQISTMIIWTMLQFDKLKVKLSEVWSELFKRGPPDFKGLKNFTSSIYNRLKSAVSGWQLRLPSNLLPSDSAEVTKSIKSFVTKITSAFSGINTTVKSMFSRVWGKAHDLFPNLGPAIARVRARLAPIGALASAAFRKVGAAGGVVARGFGIVGRGLKGMLGNVGNFTKRLGGMLLNSTRAFSVLKHGLRRVGDYAAGGMRVAIGAFMKFAGVILKSILPLIMAVGAGLVAMGGQAIVGVILALGGAFFSVAQGAALLAPALLAVAGISFAALKIGLEGVKEGVKAAFSAGTAEEFEQAIAKLPPAAQNIARAFREFQPQVKAMKEAVQNNLLADIGPGIQSAMSNLLPTFDNGLRGIATHWNGALKLALSELSSPEAQNGLQAIMQGANEMAANMQPVLANLLKAAGSLAEQGSKYLGGIGQSIADMTSGWAAKAEGLKEIDAETGLSKFDKMIQSAKTNLGFLKDILGGLLGTLGNLFTAAAEGGGGILGNLATGMQALKEATAEGSQGFQDIVTFMKAASSMASLLGELIKPVLSIVAQVGATLSMLAANAMPGIIEVVQAVQGAIKPLFDIADKVGKSLSDAFSALAPAVSHIGEILAPVIQGLASGVSNMFVAVGPALDSLFSKLAETSTALMPLFETVGTALGNIFAACGPILESTLSVINAFAPVLDLIFKYLGDIVTEIINGLAPLFTGHDSVLIKLADSLKPVVETLGDGLLAAIRALQPAIPPIMDAISKIIEALLPLLPLIKDIIGVVMDIVVQVITDIFVPLIKKAADIIAALVPPIVEYVVPAIKLLVEIILGILHVAFTTMIQLWSHTVLPIINALGDVFIWLGDLIKRYIETFIAPAMNFMSDVIKNVFGFIVSLIKGDMSGAIDHLKGIFQAGVDFIKTVWDKLKEHFATPIRFFVDVILNKGIVGGWNAVADFFKIDKKLKEFPMPAGLNFATGGVMPGYTPGRDPHQFYSPTAGSLALSGGEAIMRPEWTRAVGGPAAVEAMNKTARTGGVRGVRKMLGEGAQYKDGGVFDEKIHHVLDQLKSEHGKPYQYGGTGNPSWDCSGLWSGIVQALNGGDLRGGRIFNTESNFGQFGFIPGLSGRITIGVLSGAGGGENGHMAGTIDGINLESSGDHGVQIGGLARGSDHSMFNHTYTLKEFLGEFISGGNGGGRAGFLQILLAGAQRILDGIIKPILDRIPGGDSPMGSLLKGVSKQAIDGLSEFMRKTAQSLAPQGGSGFQGDPGAGVEQYRGLVEHILESKGLPKTLANSLLRRMNQESGGNPRAINNWDSNATAGTPSKGLMQVIDPTFQTYKDPGFDDIWDPEANIRASINYALSRYGSLPAAYDRSGGYDSGGEALGVGYMPKYTLKPERVLSPTQTQAFNDFVYGFMPALINSYKRNPALIRNLSKDVTKQLKLVNENLLKQRDARIDRWSEWVAEDFRQQEKGTKKLNPIDMSILQEKWWKKALAGGVDGLTEALDRYMAVNGDKLKTNLNKAVSDVSVVLEDPHGYLKAEEVARERVEKEKEEAEKKAEEEKQEAERKEQQVENEHKSDLRKKEREATNKKKKEELKAAKSDAEKKAIEARYAEAEKAEKRKEQDAKAEEKKEEKKLKEEQKERDKKLQDEINKKKESGEYYYGYKVLKEDGSNPDAWKESDGEKFTGGTAEALAGKFDLSGVATKFRNRYSQSKQLEANIKTVLPSWYAALNGDTSGLRHNVAAASAMTYDEAEQNFKDFGPEAVAGVLELGVSGIASRRAVDSGPLIENAYLGMTKAELIQGLSKYDAMKARRGSGTPR